MKTIFTQPQQQLLVFKYWCLSIITCSWFSTAFADNPFADAKQLPSSTDGYSAFGKMAYVFGNTFTLVIFGLVVVAIIVLIIHILKAFTSTRETEDYSEFLKKAGLAIAGLIIIILFAGWAFLYGIDKITALQQ